LVIGSESRHDPDDAEEAESGSMLALLGFGDQAEAGSSSDRLEVAGAPAGDPAGDPAPVIQARSRRERRERERAAALQLTPAETPRVVVVPAPDRGTAGSPVVRVEPAPVVLRSPVPAESALAGTELVGTDLVSMAPVDAGLVGTASATTTELVGTAPAAAELVGTQPGPAVEPAPPTAGPAASLRRRDARMAEVAASRSRRASAGSPHRSLVRASEHRQQIAQTPGRRPRGRRQARRSLFAKLMPVGAMIGAGLMVIATTVPANAFYSATEPSAPVARSAAAPAQSLRIDAAAAAAPDPVVARDAYTVSSLLDQVRLLYGNRSFSYTNDPNGTIQWPFAIPVPISSGFGPRAGCSIGCSTFHEGVDFTPGAGAPIQAIADGVVSAAVVSNAGYGNYVIIDHVINGQKVQSMYAHMQYGSIRVAVGQHVKVTDIIGLVGSTGIATGPHLHFEIILGGVPVDPFAWLKANAN
jgi:hypothetical protein